MNQTSFIEKSKKIHNNKYSYELVEYINTLTEVKIVCPVHGIFHQLPKTHLKKNTVAQNVVET